MVAPSAMMDGQVAAIREALDENSLKIYRLWLTRQNIRLHFYGPFREAAESAPQFGDRKSIRWIRPTPMRPLEKLCWMWRRHSGYPIMVKPALAYLDIICRAKQEFDLPLAAYNVSGEYSMIKAAAQLGWLDEGKAMVESLTAIKRAGADIIITYFAPQVAKLLNRVKSDTDFDHFATNPSLSQIYIAREEGIEISPT